MARTMLIGLRRDPQPPMPMVMPSRSSATTSSSVIRLSTTSLLRRYSDGVGVALLDERVAQLVGRRPTRLSSNVKPCSNR